MSVSSLTVTKAVRELRQTLHESQQSFAYRMQTAVRTIARYETVRPPRGTPAAPARDAPIWLLFFAKH
jgi:DNA-binding transcriptional regulator YiaG